MTLTRRLATLEQQAKQRQARVPAQDAFLGSEWLTCADGYLTLTGETRAALSGYVNEGGGFDFGECPAGTAALILCDEEGEARRLATKLVAALSEGTEADVHAAAEALSARLVEVAA